MSNELKDKLKQDDLLWYEVRRWVKKKFGLRPDINAMLFLIGINEVGLVKESFSKEEKQDLMHVAICRLFVEDDYFVFIGRDEDGWPHYEATKKLPSKPLKEQESLLKTRIIDYFDRQFEL